MSDRPLEDYSLPYLWKRIAELEATIKKVEAVGFEVHDSWGVSEEFNSGWIACRAQVELALLIKIDELEANQGEMK